jgi:hypothetical protein
VTIVQEEPFDKEKVEELVSELNADDLYPVIAEAGPEKLAAIKEAEEAGKARKGVLGAIEDREAELEEVEEDEEPATQEFELAELEEAPPLILVGFWVRLGAGVGVPRHAVGRDGVIVFAPTRRSQGQDTISERPYEFQDGAEVFTVRLRDTNELIQTTRDSFQAFAPEQADLLEAVRSAA